MLIGNTKETFYMNIVLLKSEVSNRHYMCSQNRSTKTCKPDNYLAKVLEKIMFKQIKILKSNLPLLKEALYESFSDSHKESRDQEIDVLNSQIE